MTPAKKHPQEVQENESGCPYEKEWRCELLHKPCHPGMDGCALFGQPLVDALLVYEEMVKSKQ